MKVFAGLNLLFWGDAGFAQNTSVIPDTEALKHIGQSVTVEGTVAKVFTSKNGNTFLIFGGDIIHL